MESMKTRDSFILALPSIANIAPQEYRIKIDGTGLTRLTPAEGSHRVDLSPADNYFVDKWSDVNTPTQTASL